LLNLLLLSAVYADYRESIFCKHDKRGSIDNEERRNVEISVLKSRMGVFSVRLFNYKYIYIYIFRGKAMANYH
jgi:hypothetical protein